MKTLSEKASAKIVQNLPYLRRYARALTGSQSRGDEYVRLCLEALLEEAAWMEPSDVRVQLFAAFHHAWTVVQSSVPPSVAAEFPQADDQARYCLVNLPSIERQVLLLVYLEGFSYEDVAYILRISEAEVREHLRAARNNIQRQPPASILIIEDEPLVALDIGEIVAEMGHTVCGTAARAQEAIELAERMRPTLILEDINLKDGDSGIDAVRSILTTVDAPVVFVTGYPERLLQGESVEPAFIVTKPFEPETLKTIVGQALSLIPRPAAGNDLAERPCRASSTMIHGLS